MHPAYVRTIDSIPAPEYKKISKYFFDPQKEKVILSPKVCNEPVLQDKFSEPVALDTRTFHLLNYGLEKIYGQVSEDSNEDLDLRGEQRITHLEAEKMNATLHNKFKGGVIRENADQIEKNGGIRDLLDPTIRMRSKYTKRVYQRDF